MGLARLSPKSTRRIARATGLPVFRAWGNGGYTMGFVTTDHRHGWWSKKTGEWGWHTEPAHTSSCPGHQDCDWPAELLAALEKED